MTARRPALAAAATIGALAVAVALLVSGAAGRPYVVHAQFEDAGQLVRGNLVQVGGRRVGEVTSIDLTEDGLAEVELTLDDDGVRPLRQGTRAAIRTVGLSGVANRFVDLLPGPASAPAIAERGVIGTGRTRGVVDLDMLLNGLDGEARRDVRTIVREASVALTPATARQANAGLAMLNPAVSRLTALGRELTADEAALRSLLRRTASLGTQLSRRREDLGPGIEDAAGTLAAVASEREALTAALERAPAVLRGTTRTLGELRRDTLPALDPFLRAARPAIEPLHDVLRIVEPTLDDARPVMRAIRRVLPEARAALEPLPRVERDAAPALRSATRAIGDAQPLITGLRPYAPDLVAGLFLGFGGSTAGYYDANGHYARVQLMGGPGSLPGLVPRPPDGGYVTGRDARCPGGATGPHADRSNPWPEGARGACDPEDDHR
jgi:phospholipid/cholesterol/gamma-HCH transport system substrate-binding protein